MTKLNKYYLKYNTKESAMSDLKSKGLIDNDGVIKENTYLDIIDKVPISFIEETGQYTYNDGFHVNIYTLDTLTFNNDTKPKTPFRTIRQ